MMPNRHVARSALPHARPAGRNRPWWRSIGPDRTSAGVQPRLRSSRIISAAFSAIIRVGELVLPDVIRGITEASTMRRVSASARAATERSSSVDRSLGAIRGGTNGSGAVMWTPPRDDGRRWQTGVVKAGNPCSGSPKRSGEGGCACYSRSGLACASSDFANAPSRPGDIDIGPRRNGRYSGPMPTFPSRLFARSFSVATPRTLYAIRNCR